MCNPTTGVRSREPSVLFSLCVRFRATQGRNGTGAHVRIWQQIRKETGNLDREWVAYSQLNWCKKKRSGKSVLVFRSNRGFGWTDGGTEKRVGIRV